MPSTSRTRTPLTQLAPQGRVLSTYGPSLLFGLAEAAVLPVLPLSTGALGGSLAAGALVLVVMNAGSLVFNVPATVLTSRYGERRAIVAAAAAGAVATVLWWIANAVGWIFAGALLYGFAGSVFMLARQKYLTEAVSPRVRGRALSTLAGTMRIGAFVGPFAGAALISWQDLRAAYLLSLVALLTAGALAWRLPELQHGVPAPRGATGPTMRTVLRSHGRVFATAGLGVLLIGAVRASRQAVIPLWAQHLGLSAETTSVVYGAANVIDMLAFYPAGLVMDRRGRRWVTVPAMTIMGISLLVMPLTTSLPWFVIVCVALGLGNGIGSGMVMTLGADFSPDRGRAQFLGIWRQLSDLGSLGGPALLSAVTTLLALGPAIALIGTIGLGAAAILWRYSAPRPEDRVSAPDR